MIAAQAALTQAPVDMPIAESELISGYLTEYSGIRFLLFCIGEFATSAVFSAVAATLFLGGWYVPGINPANEIFNVIGPLILFGKMMLVAFFIYWFRLTYPRFREDQLQRLAWKSSSPAAWSTLWPLAS